MFKSKALCDLFGVNDALTSKYCLTVSQCVMSPEQGVRSAAHNALPFVLSCCNPRKLINNYAELEKKETSAFFTENVDAGIAATLETVKRIAKHTLSPEANTTNAIATANAKTIKSLSVNNRAAQLERTALFAAASSETTPSARLRALHSKSPYAQHNGNAEWYTPFCDALPRPTGGPVPHIVEKNFLEIYEREQR